MRPLSQEVSSPSALDKAVGAHQLHSSAVRLVPRTLLRLGVARLKKLKPSLIWWRAPKVLLLSKKPLNQRMGKGMGSYYCTRAQLNWGSLLAGIRLPYTATKLNRYWSSRLGGGSFVVKSPTMYMPQSYRLRLETRKKSNSRRGLLRRWLRCRLKRRLSSRSPLVTRLRLCLIYRSPRWFNLTSRLHRRRVRLSRKTLLKLRRWWSVLRSSPRKKYKLSFHSARRLRSRRRRMRRAQDKAVRLARSGWLN